MTFETPAPAAPSIDWKALFISFEGRIRRSHFWIAWLILLGANLVLGWIPVIGWLISIALLWPSVAITVKRLHDMGHTGWLALIPWAVTFIGLIFAMFTVGAAAFTNAAALESQDPAAALALLGPSIGVFGLVALVSLAFLLWIGLTDGQRGPNRFGPNPKGL